MQAENERFSGLRRNIRRGARTVILASALSSGFNVAIADANTVDRHDNTGSSNPIVEPLMPQPQLNAASVDSSSASAGLGLGSLKADYSLKINLNYDSSQISGTETVDITNTANQSVSELNFSVLPKATGEFNLGTVQVEGQVEQPYWTNNSNLAVDLPNALGNGEQTTVSIAFNEHPSSNVSTFLGSSLSERNGIMQVSGAFPILSDGHPMRMPGDSQFSAVGNYHMELSLNRPMAVAAPGKVSAPDSTTRIVDLGPARNFSFSVSPDYLTKTGYVNGTEVDVFYKSGTAGARALSIAKNALSTFDNRFIQYPYDRFVVAQGTRPVSGNEFPGIVFVGSSWLGNTEVVTHETSHQWFYGMLGNDQMQDPWLDEGFAEWAGTGFSAHSYCSTKYVDSSVYAFPNKFDYLTTGDCGSYDQTVYYKASSFIQGVRSRMGDSAFFASLKNLFQNYKFRIVDTGIVANNWLNYTPSASQNSLKNYMNSYIRW